MSKPTGFTPEQVAAILLREGSVCAMYGADDRCRRHATTANHRKNRGAGGSKLRNGLGNGCAICDRCNGDIESDPEYAELARARGVKLRATDEIEGAPLWSPFFDQWVTVDDYALRLTGDRDVLTPPRKMHV